MRAVPNYDLSRFIVNKNQIGKAFISAVRFSENVFWKTAFSETSHADFGSLLLNPDNFNKVCCDGPFSRNNTPAF